MELVNKVLQGYVDGELKDIAPSTRQDNVFLSTNQEKTIEDGLISVYICTTSGTTHALTGTGNNIKFVADAAFEAGDTITVNGQAVTAQTQDGVTLAAGAWASGATVVCWLDGTTLNFIGGGGLSPADQAKLIPQNIRKGVVFFEGTSKEVTGALEPIFAGAGWSGSAYWFSDLNSEFYGPSIKSFTLKKEPVMAFVRIGGTGTTSGVQIGDKYVSGEGTYVLDDITGTTVQIDEKPNGSTGNYFAICVLG